MPFLLIMLLTLVSTARARFVNVTVDDTSGVDLRTGLQPEYTPPFVWTGHAGPSFRGVDRDRLHDHTMQAPDFNGTKSQGENATFALNGSKSQGANVTFAFNGMAIYVFAVRGIRTSDTSPTLTFYLDGEHVGQYISEDSTEILYDQLAFKSAALAQDWHTLVVQFLTSDVALDYLVYLTDDSSAPGRPATSSARTPIPSPAPRPLVEPAAPVDHKPSNFRVVTGLAATVEILVISLCAFYFLRRCRRRRREARRPMRPQTFETGSTASLLPLDGSLEGHVQPFTAQPDPAAAEAPLPPPKDAKTRWIDTAEEASRSPSAEEAGNVRAELDRLRMQHERAQIAYEDARAEIELLRLAAEPPPYSDAELSENRDDMPKTRSR